MGFIMGQGPGTSEVLAKLRDIFDANVNEAAIFAPMFDRNGQGKDSKNLMDCAIELGIMPSDPRHQFQWRKWLRWTFHRKRKDVHDAICDALNAALSRNTPLAVYCDWVEDQDQAHVEIQYQPRGASFATASRMYLTVHTARADQIGMTQAAKKKAARKRVAKRKKSSSSTRSGMKN